MDHEDAATQVIEDASRVVLPDAKANVVARVKRDFARQGHCDASLIAVIEKAIQARLAQWSLEDVTGRFKIGHCGRIKIGHPKGGVREMSWVSEDKP